MSRVFVRAVMLVLFWSLSASLVGAAEDKTGKGEDRLRSVVQTRCMLECEWLVNRFGEEETAASKEKLQTCRAGCVEAKKVAAALADRPADVWGLSYELKCPDGTHMLFFDMYHCGSPKSWQAPKGFTRPLA